MGSTAVHAGEAGSRTRDLLAAGALAGILGAAAMAVFMVLAALVDERPIEMALRPIVAYADGEGAALAVVGALQLAAAAAALGIVLASLLPHDLALGGAAVAGAAYALTVLSILTSVAEELRSTMAPLGGSWVIAFGVFGAVLGIAPALRRRQARRAARRAGAPGGAVPAAERGHVRGGAPA